MSLEDFWLNIYLFRVVNSIDHPLLNLFFYYFSFLGSGFFLIPVTALLWFWRRHKLKALAVGVVLETALVSLLKIYLNQPRPATLLEEVKLLVPLYYRSFPSGDTAMAFLIAGVLSYGERAWIKLALFTYATLIAIGRIYLGVHFPLDVVVGALIGLLCAYVSLKLLSTTRRMNAKDNPPGAE
jgi:membrane-associated phospholipid phosphatase